MSLLKIWSHSKMIFALSRQFSVLKYVYGYKTNYVMNHWIIFLILETALEYSKKNLYQV